VQTTRLHASFAGSNSSLSYFRGELSLCRQWKTQRFFCIFWFWGKMFFGP